MATTHKHYTDLSDLELIDLILDSDEDAAYVLINERCASTIRFHILRYYDSVDNDKITEIASEVYMSLKGKDGKWRKLRSFKRRSSFATWINTVISRIVLKQKIEGKKKGLEGTTVSIEEKVGIATLRQPELSENIRHIMLLEAISRLKDEEQRFVLIKELDGHSPTEIAQLLNQKRQLEQQQRKRNGRMVIITPGFVYTTKSRALKEVKQIMEQLKREWDEN